MSLWGVWVDVEALRAVGRDVTDVAVALGETVKGVESRVAPDRMPGSEAGAAAMRAQEVWGAALNGFVGRVDEYGTKLGSSADNYQSGDEQVLSLMSQLLLGGMSDGK